MSKKPYVEPAVGTIRGPFICGKDTRYKKVGDKSVWTGFETVGGYRSHEAGVQFAIKLADGRWGYEIGWRNEVAEVQRRAEERAKKEIAKEVKISSI